MGPVFDWSARANMTYDAVPRPPAAESTGFVYDSGYARLQLDGPVGFVYDCVRRSQDYDPPASGITATYDSGPLADEPTIFERKPGGAEGKEP